MPITRVVLNAARSSALTVLLTFAPSFGGAQVTRASNLLQSRQDTDQQQPSVESVPRECAEEVSPDTGEPFMFRRGPLIWGLSARPAAHGQKLLVLLWLYNPTDKLLSVATCGDIDYFWAWQIAVFDSAGRPVLSRVEDRQKKENDTSRRIFVCGRNFLISVPSRTCLHGSFSKPEYDFARNLEDYYSLRAGRYLIIPKETGPEVRQGTSPQAGRKLGLELIVKPE
jgi:hypothetical protein